MRWLALFTVLFAGCLSLLDPTGRRCDEQHGCAGGRVCTDGFCVVSADAGLAVDAGADADAGHPDAGVPTGTVLFREDFEDAGLHETWLAGTTRGQWMVDSLNQGTIQVQSEVTQILSMLSPTVTPSPPRLARITSVATFGAMDLRLQLKVTPLSLGSHRGAAVHWHLVDADRGYALTLDGFEWGLFRHDPSDVDGRRVLASGTFPVPVSGQWIPVRVVQTGDLLTGWINGPQIFKLVDPAPFQSGPIGLSAEEAEGQYDDLVVLQP